MSEAGQIDVRRAAERREARRRASQQIDAVRGRLRKVAISVDEKPEPHSDPQPTAEVQSQRATVVLASRDLDALEEAMRQDRGWQRRYSAHLAAALVALAYIFWAGLMTGEIPPAGSLMLRAAALYAVVFWWRELLTLLGLVGLAAAVTGGAMAAVPTVETALASDAAVSATLVGEFLDRLVAFFLPEALRP